MKGHKLHVRRKMKEINGNEENRGLIDKKAYADQMVTFCQFIFGSLSLFFLSLSHSWTHRVFLEHFGIRSRKENKARESKEQPRKSRIKKLQ